MDAYLGEIRLFPFGFVPTKWLPCAGQPLSTSTYAALFSILGTMYGGNGTTTFNLPLLVDYSAVNQGQGPGLTNYTVGMVNGINTVNLLTSEIPSHNHLIETGVVQASATTATNAPANAFLAKAEVVSGSNILSTYLYSTTTDNTLLASNTIGAPSGAAGSAHDNHQPYLGLQYCICIAGIYPPRG